MQRHLDLVRVDVESGDQDHVLLAIDNVEISLLVHASDVAGMQPAVGVDDFRRVLGPVPVSLHDLGPRTRVRRFLRCQGAPFVILDIHLCGGDGQSDRGIVVGEVQRIDAHGGRGFGQPIGFGESRSCFSSSVRRPRVVPPCRHRGSCADWRIQFLEARRIGRPLNRVLTR